MDHGIEALCSPAGTPLADEVVLAGIRILREGMLQTLQQPDDLEARRLSQYGSWLRVTAYRHHPMGASHGIGHVLGLRRSPFLSHTCHHAEPSPLQQTIYGGCAEAVGDGSWRPGWGRRSAFAAFTTDSDYLAASLMSGSVKPISIISARSQSIIASYRPIRGL